MNQSPYMTRQEAADWLRCSTDTIDRILTGSKRFEAGKIRFARVVIGSRYAVRLVAEDVKAILPDVTA